MVPLPCKREKRLFFLTGKFIRSDNAGNESGFRIERCKNPNCTSFAQITQVGAGVTTFGDTTVTKNTAYSYRVRAFNTAGNSAYSNTASAKTPK